MLSILSLHPSSCEGWLSMPLELCGGGQKAASSAELLLSSISAEKPRFKCAGTQRRISHDSIVMFSSYLYLAERDLFRACDTMKNQSDYETRLSSYLVRR